MVVAAALMVAALPARAYNDHRGHNLDSLERAVAPVTPPADLKLTDREMDILNLLAKAYTSKQIAEALFLSPETINWYRKKLLVKFDVANTPELVLKAKEIGLI